MALTLSNSISGEFLPSESSGFFVYALRRDAEYMLYFAKVSAAGTELGEFYRADGTGVPEFGDGIDYGTYDVGVGKTSEIRNDIATDKKFLDDPNDKYQQIRFDRRNLYYYIDDDGFFVIRFNGPDYDYNSIGPK
jgi:hypothetical protein